MGASGPGRVYGCERDRAPLAPGVVGTRGVPSGPSHVQPSLTTWGKLRPTGCRDGFVCVAGESAPWQLVVTELRGPRERRETGAPHPRLSHRLPD